MTREKSLIYQLQFHFNWKHAIIITLIFCVLVKLGFWQLSRADQKRQIHATYLERQNATPIAIENLATLPMETINHLHVQMTGYYLNDKSIYVSNKLSSHLLVAALQSTPSTELSLKIVCKRQARAIALVLLWVY